MRVQWDHKHKEERVRIKRRSVLVVILLTLGVIVSPATFLFAQSTVDVSTHHDNEQVLGSNSRHRSGHHDGGRDHSHGHHAGQITSPTDARNFGLDSLRHAIQEDGGVPLPLNLSEFVKDRWAAIQLGKALFWDMQVGSDGVQACASCHFHAGTDDRSRNRLNPSEGFKDERQGDIKGYLFASDNPEVHFETKQPNGVLTRDDFPFVKTIQDLVRSADGNVGPGYGNSNDIAGSMGTFFTAFNDVLPGKPVDSGTPKPDPVFNIGGQMNVRQVGPFNAPTVINAVFNFTNNWNGTANPHFNGRDVFGEGNPNAVIFVNEPGMGLVRTPVSLDNASLASQAVNPPQNSREMSFGDPSSGNARRLSAIGVKLLRPSPETGVPLTPLGLQQVHSHDSTLAGLAKGRLRGLHTTYEAMIKKAFVDKYWNSPEKIPSPAGGEFSQMEANFSFFFGLSVALYQSTLVADETLFDQWMETGHFNEGFGRRELAGLNLFVGEGRCVQCHAGPELTAASVRSAKGGQHLVRAMAMGQGTALYDNGFYNIGVTPTTDDLGRGGVGVPPAPISFSRQALFSRLASQLPGVEPIGFPILGNDHIPARDEDLDLAVCDDKNGNGWCDLDEAIRPEFQRVAVDGAFKTPGLRNAELTGPYFHNGGMATLRQVVQFYNRGGNFCSFNFKDLDPAIAPIRLTEEQEEHLVAFLVSLTDRRVKYQRAPFDHPELRLPQDGRDTEGTRVIPAVGAHGSPTPLKTFLELDPQDVIYTPRGQCLPNPLNNEQATTPGVHTRPSQYHREKDF